MAGRAGAPQRQGGRRAGREAGSDRRWSCALGPWPRLGEQPPPHRLVAFCKPPATQVPLPTAGEAPLAVVFGLSSVRRCRRPPLPGMPTPHCPVRVSHCVWLVKSHPRPGHQASAGNSQSTLGNPEPGPPSTSSGIRREPCGA